MATTHAHAPVTEHTAESHVSRATICLSNIIYARYAGPRVLPVFIASRIVPAARSLFLFERSTVILFWTLPGLLPTISHRLARGLQLEDVPKCQI